MLRNAALLCLLLSSACGGKVVFDNGSGGSGGSGIVASATHAATSVTHASATVGSGGAPSNLPKACLDADKSIDWSQCPDEPASDRTTRSYCPNIILAPGCETEVEKYYECLGQNPSSCVETPNPSSGSAGFSIQSANCEAASQAFIECLNNCIGGSTCPTNLCTCNPGAPDAGATCCWYPNCPSDNSIPNCFAVCEVCDAMGD